MNPYDIITHFYPQDNALRRLLILHSEKVRDKAFSILEKARVVNSEVFSNIDEALVNAGALLHDVGIGNTHAPGILCSGNEPYICHGTIGAEMIRQLPVSFFDGMAMQESVARICERHTGAGLSLSDIESQQLPIHTTHSLVPVTLEEQLVCLADKFYSKSGDASVEKDFARVTRSMMKFGTDSQLRFESMCKQFYLNF